MADHRFQLDTWRWKTKSSFLDWHALRWKKRSGVRTLLFSRAWCCSLGEELLLFFLERSYSLLRRRRNKSWSKMWLGVSWSLSHELGDAKIWRPEEENNPSGLCPVETEAQQLSCYDKPVLLTKKQLVGPAIMCSMRKNSWRLPSSCSKRRSSWRFWLAAALDQEAA
jgi:hypothetical protein